MVEGILKCRDTILSSIGGFEPALVQVVSMSTEIDSSEKENVLHNYVQLVADEGKNTFKEEEKREICISELVKERGLVAAGKKRRGKPPSRGVASSSSDTNQTKNSVTNLDDQLLGKPTNYIHRNVL